jgi:hypothetical protein
MRQLIFVRFVGWLIDFVATQKVNYLFTVISLYAD